MGEKRRAKWLEAWSLVILSTDTMVSAEAKSLIALKAWSLILETGAILSIEADGACTKRVITVTVQKSVAIGYWFM